MTGYMVDLFRRCGVVKPNEWVARLEAPESEWDDEEVDWGSDSDVPIDSSCDLENPEECESCQ